MEEQVKQTGLHQWHVSHGAKMANFGGYDMPLWYSSAKTEHLSVFTHAGLFDTSHMGRTFAKGPEVVEFLNWVVTNDISRLGPMEGLYTVMLKPDESGT